MINQRNFQSLLFIFLLLYTLPLFGQQNQSGKIDGTIMGKITDKASGEGLSFVNVVLELDNEERIAITSDLDGFFLLKAPEGEHRLKTSYVGYEEYSKPIKVNQGKTTDVEIELWIKNTKPPWESTKPYPELQGFWKPVKYISNKNTVDQSSRKDRSGIGFWFPEDGLPGSFSWNDGCNTCSSFYFRHLGNGVIELQKDGQALCTLIGCDTNKDMLEFLTKMNGTETKTAITNEGQQLELSLGKEKFIFKKIHDSTYPEFSTELFGTWTPVKGKLNGREICKFEKNAEVVFDYRKDVKTKAIGSIVYQDGGDCSSEDTNLTYRYIDEDFLSFQFYSRKRKPKVCERKYVIGEIFYQLSKHGCHIEFDEYKATVTFEYRNNQLVLERWK